MKTRKMVCPICFKENCDYCSDKDKVEIDLNILPTIKILNEKGYKTEFCCSGHINLPVLQIYITFENKYIFDNLPKGFYCLDTNDNTTTTIEKIIKMKDWRKKSNSKRYKEIIKGNKDLLEWAKDLETRGVKNDF